MKNFQHSQCLIIVYKHQKLSIPGYAKTVSRTALTQQKQRLLKLQKQE